MKVYFSKNQINFLSQQLLCLPITTSSSTIFPLSNFAGNIKLGSLLKPDGGVDGFLATAPTYIPLTRTQFEELLDSDVHLDQLEKVNFWC
jgi:hypothetical protein